MLTSIQWARTRFSPESKVEANTVVDLLRHLSSPAYAIYTDVHDTDTSFPLHHHQKESYAEKASGLRLVSGLQLWALEGRRVDFGEEIFDCGC